MQNTPYGGRPSRPLKVAQQQQQGGGLSGDYNNNNQNQSSKKSNASLSSIKKSKNRHLVAIDSLKKRDGWNERFVLEKIPTYQYQNQKVYQPVAGGKMGQGNQKQSQEDPQIFQPGRIRRPPSSNVNGRKDLSREQVVQKYYNQADIIHGQENSQNMMTKQQLEDRLKELQAEINQIWEDFNIPHFHRDLYVRCQKLLPRKQLILNIEKEIELIKQKRAPIQSCIRAIKARESCLNQLKEKAQDLQSIKEDDQQLGQSIEKISELVVHQRILSLNVVESILRWRQVLNQSLYTAIAIMKKMNPTYDSKGDKISYMPFIYNFENYIIKMNQDTLDLRKTDLVNYMSFSDSVDPFFLSSQKAKMGDRNQVTILHEIKTSVLQRIRASELIILEETLHKKLEENRRVVKLISLDCDEEEVQEIYGKYLQNVETSYSLIKDSILSDPEQLLKEAQYAQECSWFKLINEDTQDIQGIAVISIDKNCFSCRRMQILHISTVTKDLIGKIIDKIVNLIWQNDTCEEIRISLKHVKEENEEKFAMNKDIADSLKKHGFKWKSLINDKDTGLRTTIMGAKRGENNKIQENDQIQTEPIQFKSGLLLSKEEHNQQLQQMNYIEYDQSPSIVACLNQIIDQQQIEVLQQNQNDFMKHIMQLLETFSKKKLQLPGSLVQKFTSSEELNKVLKTVFSETNFSSMNNQEISCCLLNMVYRWQSFQTVTLEQDGLYQKYLRINPVDEDTISVSNCEDIKNQIYIIQTDDEKVSTFLFNLEQEEMDKIETGNFHEFVQKIIKDCNQKQSSNQELWIPAFKKQIDYHDIVQFQTPNIQIQQQQNQDQQQEQQQQKQQQENNQDTDKNNKQEEKKEDIQIQNQEQKQNQDQNNQEQIFKTCVSKLDFSLDYEQQIKSSLKIKGPKDDAYIFKAPFVFGLIHSDVAESLDFPMFSTLVKIENY